MEVEIHDEVFNKVYYDHLLDDTPLQIIYGGSSSGKSFFAIGQRPVYDLLNGGRNYLITRQVGRTIRNSVFNEVVKTINSWGLQKLFNINKSDMVITCENGYQILFCGLDDVEKLKSITPAKGVITDVVAEEATETEYDAFKQLNKRLRGGNESVSKRITLLFNPITQSHWIYKEFFESIGWADKQSEYKSDDMLILKTTYKDNKFLTKQDVYKLESEKDKYYFDVYTLGNWGVLGKTIFRHKDESDPAPGWYVKDLSSMRSEFTNHKHGLDFGYSSDPAALWISHYDRAHKTIYLYDEMYETGLTNDVLAELIKDKLGKTKRVRTYDNIGKPIDNYVFDGTQPVTCDSAEPKSITELRSFGVGALTARKGKDSVLYGLQWLQQQTIIVDTHCINARNELMTYQWKEDAGGNALPIPQDKNNHLIDAGRYAYEDEALTPDIEIQELNI